MDFPNLKFEKNDYKKIKIDEDDDRFYRTTLKPNHIIVEVIEGYYKGSILSVIDFKGGYSYYKEKRDVQIELTYDISKKRQPKIYIERSKLKRLYNYIDDLKLIEDTTNVKKRTDIFGQAITIGSILLFSSMNELKYKKGNPLLKNTTLLKWGSVDKIDPKTGFIYVKSYYPNKVMDYADNGKVAKIMKPEVSVIVLNDSKEIHLEMLKNKLTINNV